MPINQQLPVNYNVYQALNIVVDAMIEVGLLAPGEEDNLDPGTAQWAFRKLNYLLDEWAAADVFVYAKVFSLFNLIPNRAVHSIGPGTAQAPADFVVNQRPVRLESATLLLPGTNGQNVDTPIDVEDDKWWAENPVKSLTSTLPTHVYYSPDNPNGSLYFWPISSVAYPVRLQMWTILQQFLTITDPIDGSGGSGIVPPGYRKAMMLSLAEELGGEPPSNLAERAMKARAAIINNNDEPPRINTRDAGMPTEHVRPRFNFLTREPW